MPKILLVEDDAAVAGVIEQHLAEAGFQVSVAPGTTVALADISTGAAFDLLLLDLVMPSDQMNGAVFAAAARRCVPDVPIIFITGYYGFVVRSGELPGPVLYKPIDLDALVREIAARLPH